MLRLMHTIQLLHGAMLSILHLLQISSLTSAMAYDATTHTVNFGNNTLLAREMLADQVTNASQDLTANEGQQVLC